MNPPFCPDPTCVHHHDSPDRYFGHWKRAGSYMTLVVGSVARFKCLSCGRWFSQRTFAFGYYTKRTIDPREIHRAISQGESVSSIARHLGASTASIQNRIDRLSRACLAMHAELTSSLTLGEHLVADGFESFDRSQYFPNNINILVGKRSQFLYGLTHVTIRRKGRMTVAQKARRARLEEFWRAPRAGIRRSFSRVLAAIDPIWDRSKFPRLHLWTDEHRIYPHAVLDSLPLRTAMRDGSFRHSIWSSTAPRDLLNPLFAVNYYDRELRKDLAAFRRESTCFTRNVANGLSRTACHLGYHNYQKPFRVKSTQIDDMVHAEVAGIDRSAIQSKLSRLYIDRPFICRSRPNTELARIWLKRTPTPLKKELDPLPAFAATGWMQASTN